MPSMAQKGKATPSADGKQSQGVSGDKGPNQTVLCTLCQRHFPSKNALKMHKKASNTHKQKALARKSSTPARAQASTPATSTSSPKHECKPCQRQFKDKAALNQHKRSSPKHTQSRNTTPLTPVTNAPLEPLTPECDSVAPIPPAGNLFVWTDGVYQYVNTPHMEQVVVVDTFQSIAEKAEPRKEKTGSIGTKANPSVAKAAEFAAVQQAQETNSAGYMLADGLTMNSTLPSRVIWSSTPGDEQEPLLHLLQEQCHTLARLEEAKYRTVKPTRFEIDGCRKCNDCGVTKGEAKDTLLCRFHPAKKAFQRGIIQGRHRNARKTPCFNCTKAGQGSGCIVFPKHKFAAADPTLRDLEPTPNHNLNARKAVVLDCEMVGVLGPNSKEVSEVVRFSAVDFFSGEMLVDTFVEPEPYQRVISWRTKFSGVNKSILAEMKAQGRTIRGWNAARALLWRFIDASTVLVGHSLNNDLAVLRMVHNRVVDSCLLTRDAVGEVCSRSWGLKVLVEMFLGKKIQTGETGHDSLEDTFATREVVLWCLRNRVSFEIWALSERYAMVQKKIESTVLAMEEDVDLVEEQLELLSLSDDFSFDLD